MSHSARPAKTRHTTSRTATELAAVVVAAVLAVAGCSRGPTPLGSVGTSPAPAGTTSYSFDHDGLTRTYNLHVPSSLDRTQPAPLLIELHGGGGAATTSID